MHRRLGRTELMDRGRYNLGLELCIVCSVIVRMWRDQDVEEKRAYTRFVPNGTIFEVTNELSFGMWSIGRGPDFARLVKLSAVRIFSTTTYPPRYAHLVSPKHMQRIKRRCVPINVINDKRRTPPSNGTHNEKCKRWGNKTHIMCSIRVNRLA